MGEKKPVILFDGYCNLCGATVKFIQKRDKKKLFIFLALQSETAQELVTVYNIPERIDSVIFLFEEKAFVKSEAILEIARFLNFPWKFIRLGMIFPKNWLDGIYDFVAKNRYRWFGKKETCNFNLSK